MTYEKVIERLTVQWPKNWNLIAHADDKARAEMLERLRRNLVIYLKDGKRVPADFKEDKPWSVCFRLLAQDEVYWSARKPRGTKGLHGSGVSNCIVDSGPSESHERAEGQLLGGVIQVFKGDQEERGAEAGEHGGRTRQRPTTTIARDGGRGGSLPQRFGHEVRRSVSQRAEAVTHRGRIRHASLVGENFQFVQESPL